MLAKWCQSCYCDGPAELYDSRGNKASFLFWFIVMTCMVLASIIFTYKTVQGYLDTPEVTNVALKRGSTLPLPSIMICYTGGLNISALLQSGFTENFIGKFSITLSGHYVQSFVGDTATDELEKFLRQKNVTIQDVVQSHGYSCDNFVTSVKCPEPSKEERCQYIKGKITRLGNCYVLSSNHTQWYPGVWGGVNLKLKAPSDSFASIWPLNGSRLGLNHGFQIYMEKTFDQFMSAQYVSVPTNAKTEITLNPKRYLRTRNCKNDSGITTSNSCFYKCWLDEIQRACACHQLFLVPFEFKNDVKLCNVFDECSNVSVDRVKQCNDKCEPMCDEWIFESSMTQNAFSSKVWEGNEADVYIGYSSMQYTQIEVVAAFTLDMAIANVGGQAGLWLGVSIVSLIQAFYYIFKAAFSWFPSWRNSKISHSEKQGTERSTKECL